MEALTGACVSALTIYDMLKPIDETLGIEAVRILNKRGGLKTFFERFDRRLRAKCWLQVIRELKVRISSGKVVIDRLVKNGFEVVGTRLYSTKRISSKSSSRNSAMN